MIPQTAEQVAKDHGAVIEYRRDYTVAKHFGDDDEKFRRFVSWLIQRDYVILPVPGSRCVAFAAPTVHARAVPKMKLVRA